MRSTGNSIPVIVQLATRALDIVEHGVEPWPVGRQVGGRLARRGINARLEQPVERRIEGGQVEHVATKLVPVERVEMPDVEDQPVPIGDRPLVEGLDFDQPEQGVRVRARRPYFLVQRLLCAVGGGSIHRGTIPR